MAFRNKKNLLAPETEVELIAIRGTEVFKMEMKYSEALSKIRKKGWTYYIYQLGFSQFNLNEQNNGSKTKSITKRLPNT